MSNPVKEKLQRGEPAFGASFGFACAPLMEMVGLLGFDFVYLDAEHGTITPRDCEDILRAAAARGTPTLARVGTKDPQVMVPYLDTGIAGIQLPHMLRRADAEAAVRAVRFHPHGERGLAGGRWADFGLGDPLTTWVERANDELLLIAQIEDKQALDNLDEIVAVEGVDVWFVGPSDLSQSLGYPGQQNHPVAKEAFTSTIKRLRDKGKIVGSSGPNVEQTNWLMELGVQYFTVSGPRMFISGAQEFHRSLAIPAGMRTGQG